MKPTLPVIPPRPLMVLDIIKAAVRTSLDGPLDKCVGIFDEHLDPHGRRAHRRGTIETFDCRLVHKEWCAIDLQPDNRAEAS